MSMRIYGIDDYGFVIIGEAFDEMNKRFDEARGVEVWDFLDWLSDNACTSPDFEGSLFPIDDTNLNAICEECFADTLYYFPLNNYPTLFTKAYNSMDDIINEIKEKADGLLPDDFPIENYIVHITGTYTC